LFPCLIPEKAAQLSSGKLRGFNPGQVKARISFTGFRFELPKYRENGAVLAAAKAAVNFVRLCGAA
jgi:hypothetical protein